MLSQKKCYTKLPEGSISPYIPCFNVGVPEGIVWSFPIHGGITKSSSCLFGIFYEININKPVLLNHPAII
jgi:hypothetical protein